MENLACEQAHLGARANIPWARASGERSDKAESGAMENLISVHIIFISVVSSQSYSVLLIGQSGGGGGSALNRSDTSDNKSRTNLVHSSDDIKR